MKLKSMFILALIAGVSLTATAYAEGWDLEGSEDVPAESVSEIPVAEETAVFEGTAVVEEAPVVEETAVVEETPVAKLVVAEKKEFKMDVKAAAPVLTADEQAARAMKGIENQKAWIATLEKQLAGEKSKLVQMEADAAKYGSRSKSR